MKGGRQEGGDRKKRGDGRGEREMRYKRGEKEEKM